MFVSFLLLVATNHLNVLAAQMPRHNRWFFGVGEPDCYNVKQNPVFMFHCSNIRHPSRPETSPDNAIDTLDDSIFGRKNKVANWHPGNDAEESELTKHLSFVARKFLNKRKMDAATIATTTVILVIWVGAFLHSVRKGMQDDWPHSRMGGVVVALLFAPLYWILLFFGTFRPHPSFAGTSPSRSDSHRF